jgi:hypothetical protein
MAQAVSRRGFREARGADGRAESPLDDRWVEVVASQDAGPGVQVLTHSGEHPLPAQFPWRPGILPLQRVGESDRSAAVGKPLLVPATDPLELPPRRIGQLRGEHRLAILPALSVPDHEHTASEVDVLNP